VPPSLKKMKTAPSCVGKPAPYALEASSSPECARPGSTGLTRYIGETSLSFSDDKGTEDEETLKIASSSQSKAGWTEAEDKVVLLAVRTFGTQWNAVSGQLVGRTADAVRTTSAHFHDTPPHTRPAHCTSLAKRMPTPTGTQPLASATEARALGAGGRVGGGRGGVPPAARRGHDGHHARITARGPALNQRSVGTRPQLRLVLHNASRD